MIISQTIYNLFPPSEFPPHSTLPLTPTEFIQRILVPEAAVSLVIQDMQQTRAQAIATLRESAQYGVAMFPDDHTEGTSGSTNAGEQIVRERAAVRRRELEKEGREEEEIWGMFSEPMSEVDGQQSKKGRSRASSTAVNEKRESSRPPRRKASSHVGLRDTDSDSDVVMNSNDADYAPAKFRKLPAVKSSKPSTATKKGKSAEPPHAESLPVSETDNVLRPPRPRPRPRLKVTGVSGIEARTSDTEPVVSGSEGHYNPPSSSQQRLMSVTFHANGSHKVTVRGQDGAVEVNKETTPRAKRTVNTSSSSAFFPLKASQERRAATAAAAEAS